MRCRSTRRPALLPELRRNRLRLVPAKQPGNPGVLPLLRFHADFSGAQELRSRLRLSRTAALRVGLLLGLLGANDVEMVCNQCGARWPAGKPRDVQTGIGCGTLLLILLLLWLLLSCL